MVDIIDIWLSLIRRSLRVISLIYIYILYYILYTYYTLYILYTWNTPVYLCMVSNGDLNLSEALDVEDVSKKNPLLPRLPWLI